MNKAQLLLFCCSGLLVTKVAHGFQQSRSAAGCRTVSTSTCTYAQSHIGHPTRCSPIAPHSLLTKDRWHRSVGSRQTTRLSAFGAGGGGGNPFGQFAAPIQPIKSKADAVLRMVQIVKDTFRQFIKGFTNGFLLALIWNVLRGPSLVVENRGLAWGLDFAVLSTVFSLSNSVKDFVLALPSKQDGDKTKKVETDKGLDREQKASLWTVVVRNMLFPIYFGRGGSFINIARTCALYGLLTYLFVRPKIVRDGQQMNSMFAGNVNGFGGGMGGMNGPGGQASPDAMAQMLMQMMAQSNSNFPTPPSGAAQSSTPQASGRAQSSSKGFSSPQAKKKKNRDKKENVLDVEFEMIENDDDEEDEVAK
jgi:hypothetical protein